MSYSDELRVALLAVQRATLLTQAVFHQRAKGTLAKSDASPVTLGDFGAQALINHALQHCFPTDPIIGEEDAAALRDDAGLRTRVWDLVHGARLTDSSAEAEIGGPVPDAEAMLASLDRGGAQGGKEGRFWTVDPIDGTKGFLRGGQYAVCLALVVEGQVQLGVLGCPNLPVDDAAPVSADVGESVDDALFHPGRGVLFAAVRGHGANSQPLSTGILETPKPIRMKQLASASQATLCESVEAAHSAHGEGVEIAKLLGITKESVRMDSQAKYGSIARGAGDVILRLPVKKDYKECIWDFAAAHVIVTEAGGVMKDSTGKELDFSKGRKLFDNNGVITAPKAVHAEVLEAVEKVLSS